MSRGIVGRDRELALLRLALDETAAGAGGCHVISGAAGIGKSRLLRAAGDMADERDIAVAAREAFKHDLAAPLVTLAGALRQCSPPTAEFGWLSRPDRHDDPYLVLERLRASLEEFAGRRPLLIVIDDAHWMDELSALAVRELVPALASSPVRWLFAERPEQPDAPGRQTLHWLTRSGSGPIRLGVLAGAAVGSLCADVLGATADDTVLALAAGCGGNPLRIEQLLSALSRTGQLAVRDGRATVVGSELPSSFVDTVREILASLSPDTRLLLHAGAVLARPFGLEAAARLMRRDPAALFPLIDEATGAGLLTDDDGGLAFAHDLVRQAVYTTLRRAVAEQLHRDAAAVARDESRPALEVAEHLLRTGRSGAADAAGLLRTAAAQVAGAAPATAADLMLHALDAVGEHDPGRVALVAEAVGLLASASRLAEARTLGEEALHAGLDAETEAALLLGLAEACKHAGQNRTAVHYADRGLAHAGLADGTRARLYAIRAHALFYVDDPPGADARTAEADRLGDASAAEADRLRRADASAAEADRLGRADVSAVEADRLRQADASAAEADRLGRAGGEPAAAVFGLTARSLIAQAEGRMADALGHAAAATGLADRAGGAAAHRHPRIWLGSALATLDRFDEAEETLHRGRRESERLGTAWAQPLWHYYHAWLLTARGRLDDAVAEADAGVAAAEQLTAYQLAVPLLGTLVRLAVLRGEPGPARNCLDRMHDYLATGITAAPEDVLWPEAVLLDAAGATGSAYKMVTGLCDALPARPALISQDPPAAAALVTLTLTAGDRERAALVADAARQLARRNPESAAAAGAAAHAEGLLHADPCRLGEAVDRFRETPRPLALAAALADAAALGRHNTDPATVRGWYDESLSIVTACGARQARERLEGRLGRWRGTAAPPAPARPPRLPRLSPAERKVALLVAEGLTNTEVADRLFLSRHTVDSHLRKIFTKLDIKRRVELATVVARDHGTRTDG